MNAYEEKRQAKIERFEELANNARRASDDAWKQARKMADVIPFGQPILVGHHSEKSDRSYRGRIDQKYSKAAELSSKADYYEARAEAMRKNTAIFSDDPDAQEKLEDKIKRLEQQQELMVKANRLFKKNDREGLLNLGFSEERINKLLIPDFMGRIGFPDYAIKNNNANIRRLKKRVEQVEQHKEDVTTEKEIGGVRVVDNVEENRLQLFFSSIPAESVRATLKARGFRWSPSNGCWQAFRGARANWAAEYVIKSLAIE